MAAGDVDEPIAALYRLYGSRLFGLGLRLLGDRGMAEELVQETLVRLWRSASRFDPERGSVRTFTFTIARHAAIDLQRRAASRPLATAEEVEGDVQDVSDDVFDQLLLSLEVRDAVQSLSDKHRAVVELTLDHDLTQQQVADRLGLPLGTVKTRTFYALKELRLELAGRTLLVS